MKLILFAFIFTVIIALFMINESETTPTIIEAFDIIEQRQLIFTKHTPFPPKCHVSKCIFWALGDRPDGLDLHSILLAQDTVNHAWPNPVNNTLPIVYPKDKQTVGKLVYVELHIYQEGRVYNVIKTDGDIGQRQLTIDLTSNNTHIQNYNIYYFGSP